MGEASMRRIELSQDHGRGSKEAHTALSGPWERGIHEAHTALSGPWKRHPWGAYSPLRTIAERDNERIQPSQDHRRGDNVAHTAPLRTIEERYEAHTALSGPWESGVYASLGVYAGVLPPWYMYPSHLPGTPLSPPPSLHATLHGWR